MGISSAQMNLVPNPSFEDYLLCPNNWDQVNYANGWTGYGSPDYYTACGSLGFSTPKSTVGFQNAASGDSYCGLILYSNIAGVNESIGTTLSQQLIQGNTYYVTYKLVLKYHNPWSICCANNKSGLLFTTIPFSQANPPPKSNYSQFFSDTIVSDTTIWTTIRGSFIADSSYQYVYFGNFFDNSFIDSVVINSGNNYSYYLVDDICLSTDSLYCANYSYNSIQEQSQEAFKIYPNPTSQSFTLSSNETTLYIYDILSSLGNLITSGTFRQSTQISSAAWPKGLYIVRINDGKHVWNQKVVKE